MTSQTILYVSSTLLQIGATYFFARSAKYLGLSKINAFTMAFGLIVARRIVVLFLKSILPLEVQHTISYADAFIIPMIFSFLLFIGTVQFYAKLIKFKTIK